MRCPKCGQENKFDAAFCMSCGASLPDVPFAQVEKKAGSASTTGYEGGRPARETGAVYGQGSGAPASQAVTAGVPSENGGADDRAMPMSVAPSAQGRAPGQGDDVSLPGAAQPPQVTPPPPAGEGAGEASRTLVQDQQHPVPGEQGAGWAPATPNAGPETPPQAFPAGAGMRRSSLPETAQQESAAPRGAAGIDIGRSVVEEIRDFEEADGRAAPAGPPGPQAPPRPAAQAETAPTAEKPLARYYVPPEADCLAGYPGRTASPAPDERPPGRVEEKAEALGLTMALDSTQAVPLAATTPPPPPAPPPRTARRSQVTCPECYALNPEGNSYCQECGSALSPVGVRSTVPGRSAAPWNGKQQTAVLTPGIMDGKEASEPYAGKAQRAARSGRSFGPADVLALLAAAAGGVALALPTFLESFAWKKGLDIGMFTHQGAFAQGRADLLGGPGILPYQGTEFLTVGLVVAAGVALALVFLAARVGRGPMFILAGCLLLFPLAYLLFQAVLPLRQTGVEIQPSVGIGGLFFGGAESPGLGPSLWLIGGAGALLIMAGFVAPPRGWGRLFTFLTFFPAVVGLAFFSAACYNWNLFISAAGAAGLPVAIAVPAALAAATGPAGFAGMNGPLL